MASDKMDFERYTSFKARMRAVENTQQAITYPYVEIIQKEGKDGKPAVVVQKSAASSRRDTEFGEYALVCRDRVNAKRENEGTDLEIQSETIQTALHSVFGKHSRAAILADPIVFRKPYYSLFHRRREIRDLAGKESNTPEQKQHLEWLTNFMAENLKTLEKVQEGLVNKGLIDFKHLPIIFEPGTIVIGQISEDENGPVKRGKALKTENPECFLFHEISDELEDQETGNKYLDIEAFRWAYNGSAFGLTAEKLRIKEFLGQRKITELENFPLKYLEEEEKDKLVPKLIARGKKWCSYVEAQKTFNYKGVAHVPKRSTWSWEVKISPKNMSGRVVIDHRTFVEAFSELSTRLHSKSREYGEDNLHTVEDSHGPTDAWKISSQITLPQDNLWRRHEAKDYEPADAEALLCPASSPGYSLAKNDWGFFDTDLLTDVEWAPSPIEELEMDPNLKGMMQDLIMDHHSKVWSNEIVPGKGEGLMFLLYGPPGCGKTLTAELMAEEHRRPLLRISGGDLGQYPDTVERNLQSFLKLALQSSAIVLIDEADTFLAKRTNDGKHYFHNAVVSIFLKYLEYFPGVIFLTTNRETQFDEAVRSRVVRLPYHALDAKGRAKIWRSHLLKGGYMPAEQVNESFCEELGKDYELDGREIKTLANLSLAICRQRKRELSKEVVELMYNSTFGIK